MRAFPIRQTPPGCCVGARHEKIIAMTVPQFQLVKHREPITAYTVDFRRARLGNFDSAPRAQFYTTLPVVWTAGAAVRKITIDCSYVSGSYKLVGLGEMVVDL